MPLPLPKAKTLHPEEAVTQAPLETNFTVYGSSWQTLHAFS